MVKIIIGFIEILFKIYFASQYVYWYVFIIMETEKSVPKLDNPFFFLSCLNVTRWIPFFTVFLFHWKGKFKAMV